MSRDVKAVGITLLIGAVFVAYCFLITGCAQLGLEKPVTANQRIAYIYSNVTSLRVAATTALQNKQISKNTAVQVQSECDLAIKSMESARLMLLHGAPDNSNAVLDALNQAIVILSAAKSLMPSVPPGDKK